MKFNVILSVLLSVNAFMFSSVAEARPGVPIMNYENMIVTTGSGKVVTAEQFKQAVIKGGASRNWTVSNQVEGKYELMLSVRGKHMLTAQVFRDGEKYSVVYKTSINLNYFVDEEGVPTIHPNANRWLQDLKDAINAELLKY